MMQTRITENILKNIVHILQFVGRYRLIQFLLIHLTVGLLPTYISICYNNLRISNRAFNVWKIAQIDL